MDIKQATISFLNTGYGMRREAYTIKNDNLKLLKEMYNFLTFSYQTYLININNNVSYRQFTFDFHPCEIKDAIDVIKECLMTKEYIPNIFEIDSGYESLDPEINRMVKRSFYREAIITTLPLLENLCDPPIDINNLFSQLERYGNELNKVKEVINMKIGDTILYVNKEYKILSITGDFIGLTGNISAPLSQITLVKSAVKSIEDYSDEELMDIIRDARQEKFGQGRVSRKARKERKASKPRRASYTLEE